MTEIKTVRNPRRRYPKHRRVTGTAMTKDAVAKLDKLVSLLEGSEFDITSFGVDSHYDFEGDADGRVLNISVSSRLVTK